MVFQLAERESPTNVVVANKTHHHGLSAGGKPLLPGQRTMQVVFRHKPKEKRKATVKTKRAYHARKAHTKSRQGCRSCKERRIKCDETRPICLQCSQSGIQCSFYEASSTPPTPGSVASTLSIRSISNDVRALLGLYPQQDAASATLEMQYLHHFHTATVGQLGMKTNHDLLVECMAENAWRQPTMMHLMLAIGAMHLDQLKAMHDKSKGLPAPRHLQSALTRYRQELQRADGQRLDTEEADALVTTTFLLTVAGFCIDDYRECIELHDLPTLLQPITAAGCLLSIMDVVPDLPSSSRWNLILNAFANAGKQMPKSGHPYAFIKLCSEQQDELYYAMLCFLTPVLRLPSCKRQIAMLFAMIGKLWSRMQPRVAAYDEKILLLIAWWFALLLRLDVWWLNTRAVNGISAIVSYLKDTHDPDIRRLLLYPASYGTADYSWIWQKPTQS